MNLPTTNSTQLCPNCKELLNTECACLRNKCHLCGKPVGNITFTVCDSCWDKEHPSKSEPGDSEKGDGWIDVNERLPEERMLHTLVFNGTAEEYNQHVFKAIWFRERMNFKSESEGYLGEITHWRPLPEPPRKREVK